MSQNGLNGHSHKFGVARGYGGTGANGGLGVPIIALPTTALDMDTQTADKWLLLSPRMLTVTLAASSILTWSEKLGFVQQGPSTYIRAVKRWFEFWFHHCSYYDDDLTHALREGPKTAPS